MQSFFEPKDHLTNGSFSRDFSSLFHDDVTETVVTVVAASELERYFEKTARVLVKIDVEGFEPQLLAALSGQLDAYKPDLLIEVLAGVPEQLAAVPSLAGYEKFLITERGLEPSANFYFSENHRDWLLRWRHADA